MVGALTHPLAISLPFTQHTANTITAYVKKINLLLCLRIWVQQECILAAFCIRKV